LGTNPTAGDAIQRNLEINVEEQDSAKLQFEFLQQLKKNVNLLQRTGKAIKDHKSAIDFRQRARKDLFDQFRGYEFSGDLVGFDLTPQGSLSSNFRLKQIARFNQGGAHSRTQRSGQGRFAASWWSN
jgi:hypothetical protein